jgi:hypothetical protein
MRNSTAEFLVFTKQTGDKSIEVRFEDETIWLSQRMMADLFDVDVRTINEHLQNLFTSNEIEKMSTIRKFRIVQIEGKRQVERNVKFYNLDAIISVGYRVNSIRANEDSIKNLLISTQPASTITKMHQLRKPFLQKCRINYIMLSMALQLLN